MKATQWTDRCAREDRQGIKSGYQRSRMCGCVLDWLFPVEGASAGILKTATKYPATRKAVLVWPGTKSVRN